MQRYIPEIVEVGEYSLLFFNEVFSQFHSQGACGVTAARQLLRSWQSNFLKNRHLKILHHRNGCGIVSLIVLAAAAAACE